jgi:hypothetical protein
LAPFLELVKIGLELAKIGLELVKIGLELVDVGLDAVRQTLPHTLTVSREASGRRRAILVADIDNPELQRAVT